MAKQKQPTFEEAIDMPIIRYGSASEMAKIKNRSQGCCAN